MELINTFIGKLFGHDLQFIMNWKTDIATYDTGTEQRNQVYSRPIRQWQLPYRTLNRNQRDKILELFSRARGQYTTFLFEDPYDHVCELTECSITAVAAQVDFQLVKTYYPGETEEWTEDKIRIQPSENFPPIVKVDGVTKTEGADYTLDDDTGIVTFAVAPGAGKIITANYWFYYKVRFMTDQYTESNYFNNLFKLGTFPITEVL